jgi:hypothetical protein
MSDSKVHGHNNSDKCLTMLSASTVIILFEPIKLYERGRASTSSLYRQWNGGLDMHGAGTQQDNDLILALLSSIYTFAVISKRSHMMLCKGKNRTCDSLWRRWEDMKFHLMFFRGFLCA